MDQKAGRRELFLEIQGGKVYNSIIALGNVMKRWIDAVSGAASI